MISRCRGSEWILKLVIKVGRCVLETGPIATTLTVAVKELVTEGHRITVVHGGGTMACQNLSSSNGSNTDGKEDSSLNDYGHEAALKTMAEINRKFVATFAAAMIPAFGVCGGDGNIIHIRKFSRFPASEPIAEAVRVDPHWLNVISQNGGVPVLASVAVGYDRQFYRLYSDQLASGCAVGWDADALIFVTSQKGLLNSDESTVRWLEIDEADRMIRSRLLSQSMVAKLRACCDALRRGVRRARILPASEVDRIASF